MVDDPANPARTPIVGKVWLSKSLSSKALMVLHLVVDRGVCVHSEALMVNGFSVPVVIPVEQ